MRLVLDTNIYIALALQGEFVEDLVQVITVNPEIVIITSEKILKELEEKLQKKFNWPQEDIRVLLLRIRKLAQVVEPTQQVDVVKRDVKDNKILECALAGKADIIITADQDLIKLKSFRGIAIIHPKTFAWTFPEHFKKSKKN